MHQPTKPLTKDQEFHAIVKTLKQWHDNNNVGMTIDNYQKLVEVVHHAYYPLKELLEETQTRLQLLQDSYSKLRIQCSQVAQHNNILKGSLHNLRLQKKELQKQLEQSNVMFQREISQLSMDHSITENLQRDKQKLQETLKNRQNQFESLQANYFHLTLQLTERNEKQKKLRGNYEQLKSQRDIYKIKKEILQSNNQELKRQVQHLKNLIDNKKNFLLKYCTNEIEKSQSGRGDLSAIASQEGQFQRYADRQQLNELQANYAQTFQRSQREKSNYLSCDNDYLEDFSVSKKSQDDHEKKNPCIVPQMQRRSSMKKQIFSSFHEKLSPSFEIKHISLPNHIDKMGLINSLRKDSEDQIQPLQNNYDSSSSIFKKNVPSQQNQLKVIMAKQDRLIEILKQEIQELKRKSVNRMNLPRRRDLHNDDVSDLSQQLQLMNNKLKQSKKQIFELKTQKQYFQMLCQSMENQRSLKQKAYKELLLEKMKQLFSSQRAKFHYKEQILKEEIYQLHQLKQNKRGHRSISKGKFNRLVENLSPLDMENIANAPSGMNTSRHNFSDDEQEHNSQEIDRKQLIVRGNLNMSSDFLEIEEQQCKQTHNQDQDIDQANFSFQSSSSKKSMNAYAQTDEVFLFANEYQYLQRGYRHFYLTQQQVQTEKCSDQKEDVGIQVLFCEESQMQTEKTSFIDTLQYTQQTFESSEKQSQTVQKSYIERIKNNEFQDKSSLINQNILESSNDSFELPKKFEIIQANKEGFNFTFRNEQEIDQKRFLNLIEDIDEENNFFGKESSRKPILRIDLNLEADPSNTLFINNEELAKSLDKNERIKENNTEKKVNCNIKISRELIWQQNDGSIKKTAIKILTHPYLQSQSNDALLKNTRLIVKKSIQCQTEMVQKTNYAVQAYPSSQSSSQKSNSQNSHEKNINKLTSQIWATPLHSKNPTTTVNSTNNSLSSFLKNLGEKDSQCALKNLKKQRTMNKQKQKLPSWTLFQDNDSIRVRSKSSLQNQTKKQKILQNDQIEQQLYRLDSQQCLDHSSQQKEKQQFDYTVIDQKLKQLPWNKLKKWTSIAPQKLYNCEDNSPGKWDQQICYMFDATNQCGDCFKFFVWKTGAYCINNENFVILKKKGTICRQPGIFSIGNSELTLMKSEMLIRKKNGLIGHLIGNIENGNWKINLKSRQCFKISD